MYVIIDPATSNPDGPEAAPVMLNVPESYEAATVLDLCAKISNSPGIVRVELREGDGGLSDTRLGAFERGQPVPEPEEAPDDEGFPHA